MKLFTYHDQNYRWAVQLTTSLIAGKYKPIILWRLYQNNTLRFMELKKLLPASINDNSLSRQLKELVFDDLIQRLDYGTIPPKVEYSLSEKGKELIPALSVMQEWGMKNGSVHIRSRA